MLQFESKRSLAVGALIVALGLGLRAWGVTERGLAFYDEGVYLSEARFLAGALRSLPAAARYGRLLRFGGGPESEEARDLRARMEEATARGRFPKWHKNTHCLLVALCLLAVGDVDWAGHAEGCAFAVATLILVFFFGRALLGDEGALLAVLVLAVSPLHVAVSRGSLAEADSTFFLLAAVTLAHAGTRATSARRALLRLFAAGLATGLCFTANYRVVVAAPIVGSVYAACVARGAGPLVGMRLRGLFWLSVGMLLPILGWEAVFQAGFWLLRRPIHTGEQTYFTRLGDYVTGQGVRDLGVGECGALFFYSGAFVGLPVVLLAAAGLLREVRAGRAAAAYLALPLVWIVGFFLLRTQEQCVRYLGQAMPFVALAAGAAVRGLSSRRQGDGEDWLRALPAAAAAAILASGLSGRGGIEPDGSGAARAFAFLRESRAAAGAEERYLCEDAGLAYYYDPPGAGCARLPPTLEGLRRQVRDGVRYLVVTPALVTHFVVPEYFPALLERLEAAGPAAEFEHPIGRTPYFAFELAMFGRAGTFEASRAAARTLARRGGSIRVYDLGRVPW
ncbi:MAG: glycosyltransferase family 39 protein [Planctomycetes bacterium]|nr:glycosyltransferase family 39 protein [Planctomycetota bacterium]